jgi:hypothetical protein
VGVRHLSTARDDEHRGQRDLFAHVLDAVTPDDGELRVGEHREPQAVCRHDVASATQPIRAHSDDARAELAPDALLALQLTELLAAKRSPMPAIEDQHDRARRLHVLGQSMALTIRAEEREVGRLGSDARGELRRRERARARPHDERCHDGSKMHGAIHPRECATPARFLLHADRGNEEGGHHAEDFGRPSDHTSTFFDHTPLLAMKRLFLNLVVLEGVLRPIGLQHHICPPH